MGGTRKEMALKSTALEPLLKDGLATII